MNILSSSIMLADDGRPFHVQQADQFRTDRAAYAASGLTTGGNVAVLRSVFPLVADADYVLFALPSELGVDYNTHLLSNLVELAAESGWSAGRQVPADAAG